MAGTAFWNLRVPVGAHEYEINPSTPDTFLIIALNAP